MRAISPRLHELQEEYKDKAKFMLTYILEAHAQDEWPICSSRCSPGGKKIMYNQPKTVEERIAVAKDFVEAFDFKLPIMLDAMHNPFEAHYSSWPLRIYAIQNGKLIYKAQPKDGMYELEDLVSLLRHL